MTAVAAEAAVVVDNGRETSGETSLWHGAAAGAAARVDPLLRRISGLTRFDRVSCGRWLVATASFPPPIFLSLVLPLLGSTPFTSRPCFSNKSSYFVSSFTTLARNAA